MGRSWSQMGRADFDTAAPLALVDDRAVRAEVRVPAAPDAYGTAALFGDEVSVRRVAPPRAVRRQAPQADTLFDVAE
ncbi:hypothetical protein ACIQU6_27990 [Streptomyces sp. NPDC090442]|uniref:hypothetical protein n=1 Tax=Streptomyces sp. NPDC090442 TaxID=3365962 RepID=UPI0038122AF2